MNTAHEQLAEQELAATALAAAYLALVQYPRDSQREKVLGCTHLLVSGRHHRL